MVRIDPLQRYSVDSFMIWDKPIIGQFGLDIQHDQNTTDKTQRKPQDIDHGVHLVFDKVSVSDLEVVFEHVLIGKF